MKLGQVRIPLADIPGSLVGNWIVSENMFILHGSQWLSWSPDLQRAVACWQGRRLGRFRGPPGLCPLLPNRFSKPRDTDDSFLPQTLFPLCIRGSFSVLSLACCCFSSCWYSLGLDVHILQYSSYTILLLFPTLSVISEMATSKMIFPAYSLSVSLDPNPQIF